jgi:allantoinase
MALAAAWLERNPMSQRTIITGGLVVTENDLFHADVIVDGERISGLTADARAIEADERIDATGHLVLPGGIDAHTHFREPDAETKEGFSSGGRAAAAGGITTVVEMPQANPTTVTAAQFVAKRTRVGMTGVVDMALWGGIVGPGRQDRGELDGMAQAGAVGFKSFMAGSSPSFPPVDDAHLLEAMLKVSGLNMPYALHAESDTLVRAGLQAMKAAGRTDPRAHFDSRPPMVETLAVNTALFLAEQTGCWVHICHVASEGALKLIAGARRRGVRVTCETCPQYLALDLNDLDQLNGFGRCAPALRDAEEVEGIWEYVLDETVDYVCSDHCAYTAEEKAVDDIFAAPLGLSGVQTLLPVFFDGAVNERGMALPQFVRQMATNAAQIFDLYPRKGTIRIGADADLVIFDPDAEWTIRGEQMLHRQQWTPFEGKTIAGQVLRTLRRGETIYDASRHGDEALGVAGSGRFLPRGYGHKAQEPVEMGTMVGAE